MTVDYTLDELANVPLKDLADFIQKLEWGRLKAPEKLANHSNSYSKFLSST